jgi:soluble lytic murein transglycosylase-like protein
MLKLYNSHKLKRIRQNIPGLSIILRRILIVVIPAFLFLVALKFMTGGSTNPDKNYPSTEPVISPVAGDNNPEKKTKENLFYKKGYEPITFLEYTVYDWQGLLDIFASNDVNRQLKYTVSSATLENLSQKIKKAQEEFFRGSSDEILKEYGDVIKDEAKYYNLDWRLILAIIKQESAFISNAVSRSGAYGFMQIMPHTGATLEQTIGLEEHKSPRNNLIAGIYYYALLVARYDVTGEDKYKFALAAYNAGSGHVEDAMTIAYFQGQDYLKWENVKETIKMLGTGNDSLHQQIWKSRPVNGTFTNWKEPVNYVSSIMYYWGEYKKVYPEPAEKTKKRKRSNK